MSLSAVLKKAGAPAYILYGVFACLSICYGLTHDNILFAALPACLPFVCIVLLSCFERPQNALYIFFVVNFFIPLINHYLPDYPTGIITDILLAFCLLVLFVGSLDKKVTSGNIVLDVDIAVGIWLLYCMLEIFNPHVITVKSWVASIRNYALYFFLVVILTQLSTRSFKNVLTFLKIWSVLIIISTVKVLVQRYVGFSKGDNNFLYEQGGSVTHIIYYGIRYFSIFSDAAAYGGCMGMSMGVFFIVGLHRKNFFSKLYWWFVSASACLGMFLSGTRSALVVPVACVLLYLVLIKDWKKAILISIPLAAAISLLAFTDLGGSLTYIRRARTIFTKDDDRSYQIRKENQAEFRVLMRDKPFGNSLGMSMERAKNYGDYSRLTDLPTDSWLVKIWVETGVVGQIIYCFVMLFLLAKGAYLVFFKIKSDEVKGITAALISGIAGLFLMSTNSEMFNQVPNGTIVYLSFGYISMALLFDKEMEAGKSNIDEQLPENIPDNNQLQRS